MRFLFLLSLAVIWCITITEAQQIGETKAELSKDLELDANIIVSWEPRVDRLTDADLNMMISKWMGMPFLDTNNSESVKVPVDPFHRKKRNVLIIMLGANFSDRLYPDDSGVPDPVILECEKGCQSIADSILRGHLPEGKNWPSLTEVCTWQYPPSKVVSVSAERSLAKKFGARSEYLGKGSSSVSLFLDQKRQEMTTTDGKSISREKAKEVLNSNFQVTLDERVDHDALYLELATMLNHSNGADEKCNGEDGACMYNYILTGLEKISMKYGETSKEYLDAVELTRMVIESTLKSFRTNNADDLIFECIYLRSKTPLSIASFLQPVRLNTDLPFFWDGDIDGSVASWHMAFWTSVCLVLIIVLVYRCMHSVSEESRQSLLYRMIPTSEEAQNNI